MKLVKFAVLMTVALVMAGCHGAYHVPPGQAKKVYSPPPGQAKKMHWH